jgi:hypothetical protein
MRFAKPCLIHSAECRLLSSRNVAIRQPGVGVRDEDSGSRGVKPEMWIPGPENEWNSTYHNCSPTGMHSSPLHIGRDVLARFLCVVQYQTLGQAPPPSYQRLSDFSRGRCLRFLRSSLRLAVVRTQRTNALLWTRNSLFEE